MFCRQLRSDENMMNRGVSYPAVIFIVFILLFAGISGGETPASVNLALLGRDEPGAGNMVVWLQGGEIASAGQLADGNRENAAPLPGQVQAIGVQWTVAHVADAVSIYFPQILKEQPKLTFEAYDGEDWVAIKDGLEQEQTPGGRQVKYRFEPRATRQFRIRGWDEKNPAAEVEIYAYTPEVIDGKITWPEKMVKDNLLEKEILAQPEEPSFESLSLYGLSMPTWNLMGLKEADDEQATYWDGTIYARKNHYYLSLGNPPKRLAEVRDTVTRSLIDGWLPGVIINGQIGSLAVRQTTFVHYSKAGEEQPGLFVRIEVKNLSDSAAKTMLRFWVEQQDKNALTLKNGALFVPYKMLLIPRGKYRIDRRNPGAVAYDVEIAAGETSTVELVIPLQDEEVDVKHLQEASFDEVLGDFRRYWEKQLASAMKVTVPEERLNHLYKNVLAQIYINADGSLMPYGSAPSVYNGNTYGNEEGYCMLGLAMSGFYQDAQRYMDYTYLNRKFLRKVEKYGGYADRLQPRRNGLEPTYAVEAYRITRDKEWMRSQAELLKECAEWTINNRHKTMQEEDGQKPLHWGLLPKWSHGGDIAEMQTYALSPNLSCWKGLKETAWLMGELGDKETSQRYYKEAADYGEVLDSVLDRIYRPGDNPPFMPDRVYGTEPTAADYYQLFIGGILDLMPFDFNDNRIRYFTDYLEQSNRTFCLMPRFRRDTGPGGLDALYGKGYFLTKLHQDKIKEFLLAFYGYLVFNMEHDCFTSRETNAIYASDLHLRTAFRVPDMSDPLPCSSATMLNLLRHMLLTEEMAEKGDYTGNLLILYGAPRKWFQEGKTIAVEDAPSHFGKLSYRAASHIAQGYIEATITPPKRNPCQAIKLRLRHPRGKPMIKVTMDGKNWKEFDPAKELVTFPVTEKEVSIKAWY